MSPSLLHVRGRIILGISQWRRWDGENVHADYILCAKTLPITLWKQRGDNTREWASFAALLFRLLFSSSAENDALANRKISWELNREPRKFSNYGDIHDTPVGSAFLIHRCISEETNNEIYATTRNVRVIEYLLLSFLSNVVSWIIIVD